jgi:hypothetical protein
MFISLLCCCLSLEQSEFVAGVMGVLSMVLNHLAFIGMQKVSMT